MKYITLLLFFITVSISSFAQWSYNSYVDEVGDETGYYYVKFTSAGVFKDSTKTRQHLTVKTIISYPDDDTIPDIEFRLYEYNKNVSIGDIDSEEEYELAISLSNNTIKRYNLITAERTLVMEYNTVISFINTLKNEKNAIRCIVTSKKLDNMNKYWFSINAVGFNKYINLLTN